MEPLWDYFEIIEDFVFHDIMYVYTWRRNCYSLEFHEEYDKVLLMVKICQ